MSEVIGNFSSMTIGTNDNINKFNSDGSYSLKGPGTFGSGEFSSISIGTGTAINTFNADGSYTIMGTGNFGVIRATQFKGSSYIIGSSNNTNNYDLGLLYGGVGALTGLNIYPADSGISGSTGNIVFTEGNYLKQGIVFADNSFLNSASNFTNINTKKINCEEASFNSINMVGDIVGNFTTVNVNGINSSSSNFNTINGNSATFINTTANLGNFNTINGNGITTGTLFFKDNSSLSSAPASKAIQATISPNWTSNGPNAAINVPAGKWLVTFNIYITTNADGVNYLKSTANNNTFAFIAIPNSTFSTCNGTFYYSPNESTSIDLLFNVNASVDPIKSYFTAINLG